MRKIQLNVDTLEVKSFTTSADAVGTEEERALIDGLRFITEMSACSWTNGVAVCKSCGPCCQA